MQGTSCAVKAERVYGVDHRSDSTYVGANCGSEEDPPSRDGPPSINRPAKPLIDRNMQPESCNLENASLGISSWMVRAQPLLVRDSPFSQEAQEGARPSNKLGRVEGAIESVAGTLKHAKEDYTWIHGELMSVTSRLLEARLLASKIQTRMLEPRSVKTWKEFVEYLQNSWEIMRDISQCAKNVKEIQVSVLCIIESERQRQLSAGIKESRELLGKLLHLGDAVVMQQLLATHPTTLWFDHGSISVDSQDEEWTIELALIPAHFRK
ncbi:hypothetical protein K438DRAFT_1773263 [Mycena galopus ATCC 62051]|nr:hypothetical protein K438DRAFT_1773263 [Mycena galopus ATCC 62051]